MAGEPLIFRVHAIQRMAQRAIQSSPRPRHPKEL